MLFARKSMETSFATDGMHARQFNSFLRQITVGLPAIPSRISQTGFLRHESEGVKGAVTGIDLGTINSCVKCHLRSKYIFNTHCISVRYFGSGNQLSNNIEKEEVISKVEHVTTILKITEAHAAKMHELMKDYTANINVISEKHVSNMSKLENKYSDIIRKMTEKHASEKLELTDRIKKLEHEMETWRKPLVLLAIRSRIERLEKMLLPKAHLSKSRIDKWTEILTSDASHFIENEQVINFRKGVKISPKLFVETVHNIYGDFTDEGAHNIDFFVDCNELAIKELFIAMGMPSDRARISVIYTLLKSIDVDVRE